MPQSALRFDLNRNVKQVLVQHAVDLTRLQFSCAHQIVYLFGWLQKEPEGDFSSQQVQVLVRSLNGIPGIREVQFQTHNWSIHQDHGTWVVHRSAG